MNIHPKESHMSDFTAKTKSQSPVPEEPILSRKKQYRQRIVSKLQLKSTCRSPLRSKRAQDLDGAESTSSGFRQRSRDLMSVLSKPKSAFPSPCASPRLKQAFWCTTRKSPIHKGESISVIQTDKLNDAISLRVTSPLSVHTNSLSKRAVSRRSVIGIGPWRDSFNGDVPYYADELNTIASYNSTHTINTQSNRPVTFIGDLSPDARTICSIEPNHKRIAQLYIRQYIRQFQFAIYSTKWAPYFLQIIKNGHKLHPYYWNEAISLQFVVLAYVQREVLDRNSTRQRERQHIHKQMVDYQLAIQCISGIRVLKYGRKGRPHVTQLFLSSGGHGLKWMSKRRPKEGRASDNTSKHIRGRKLRKQIAFSSIRSIESTASTQILARALQKGTLESQDVACTLSIIAEHRTLDIATNTTEEREWLLKSLLFLMEWSQTHAERAAKQVESNIIQRMSIIPVWKHGRKGKAHKTKLYVNRFGEVSWLGRSNEVVRINEIKAIRLGSSTDVFTRSIATRRFLSHADINPSRCFSLITKARTLDLETQSEAIRDWFVVAFRYLIEKVQEKTMEMKLERAEKQARILRHLSVAHQKLANHSMLSARNNMRLKSSKDEISKSLEYSREERSKPIYADTSKTSLSGIAA
uniref:Uncharacterized protein AlNc14C58G4342 n=1 Tax=Albugo laibachii Nc14 TaxID=890382 RepID=F0WCG2_9STRA|nr:conserved hypothetical protein [Albugo laibachii Nc14]|eukprot:CCA18877.1 conserved hypothetical protein [Albugo laibachii Nc14]